MEVKVSLGIVWPLSEGGVPLSSTSLSVVWARSEWTSLVSSSLPPHPTMDVEWKLFFTKLLPPVLRLFMMEVFHCKLRVNSRMVTLTESEKCPVCGRVETVDRAFCGCKFHLLLFRLIEGIFSPVPYKGDKCLISQVPLVRRLNYALGICY